MNLAASFWDSVIKFLTNEGWDIVLVISIIIIAFIGIKFAAFLVGKILYKSRIDGSAVAFYVAILKVVLWILTVFAIANVLNISTSSLVVGLSSVALAIALALKDSLANLANGILIIYNKPFRRGDHIEIEEYDGIIKNIKLLTTELVTADNRRVVLPNSKVINGVIVNNTAMATRRISLKYTVAYESDMDLVEKVLKEAFESNPLVNNTPAVSVNMSGQGESSVEYTVKCWVDTDDYWTVYNGMNRVVFDKFAENGISIPFNQLDVHIDAPAVKQEIAQNNEKGADNDENN